MHIMSIQRKIARRIKSRYPVSIPREELNRKGILVVNSTFALAIYAILSVAVLIVGVIIALVDTSLIVVENRKFKRKQRRVIGWE